MTTHMNKISDYLQQQNINNSLLVHNHWHAAGNYQCNTIHKVEQSKLFSKSHLCPSHSWFDRRKYHSMVTKRPQKSVARQLCALVRTGIILNDYDRINIVRSRVRLITLTVDKHDTNLCALGVVIFHTFATKWLYRKTFFSYIFEPIFPKIF